MTILEADRGGKYLSFFLGEEEYGLDIVNVREIIGMMDVTPVPRVSECFCGVINLRGKVIPVVELRRRFDMPEVERTAETCIIVVRIAEGDMGIVVDRVNEVTDIAEDAIQDPPVLGTGEVDQYLQGISQNNGRVVLLLDMVQILSFLRADNFSELAQEVAA